jgi:DNA-binding MarR family transcriptional regulator
MNKELQVDSRSIAELVLQLGRLASAEALVDGLTAVQWAGLRYFGRANRFSRTPSAFAAFHGTTRGTASQTIRNLEARGYLTRKRSELDRRSVHLVLTEKARAILENDLFESLVRAVDTLHPGVRGQFAHALQRTLGQVAMERGQPTFGNCASCAHLEGGDCSQERAESYACGFVSEPLLLEELDGVCINFVQTKPRAERGAICGVAPR